MELWIFAFAFGLVAAEPGADHSAEVLQGAPADAEVFVYYNAEATARPAWNFIHDELPKEKLLGEIPDAKDELEAAMADIDRELQGLESMLGINPIDDADYAALWFDIKSWKNGEPDDFDLLVTVHGKWPAGFLDKMVAQTGAPLGQVTLDGVSAWSMTEDGREFAAVQLDGVLVAGTRDMVEARIGGKKATGDQADRIKNQLKDGAVLVVDLMPSKDTRAQASQIPSSSAADLLGGFEAMTLGFKADAMDIRIAASSADLYERYHHLAMAGLEMARAGRAGARVIGHGFAGLFTAGDPELPRELDGLIKNRDEVLRLLDLIVGTGEITFDDRSNKKKKTVDMEVRAGHVRQIAMPVLIVPAVLAFGM